MTTARSPRTAAPALRLGRLIGGVVAVLVLLVPSGQALADDEDPAPVPWPTVSKPESGGDQADPGPSGWPSVAKPDSSDSGTDPGPLAWPGPEQG